MAEDPAKLREEDARRYPNLQRPKLMQMANDVLNGIGHTRAAEQEMRARTAMMLLQIAEALKYGGSP
jgi:hypothetical protein